MTSTVSAGDIARSETPPTWPSVHAILDAMTVRVQSLGCELVVVIEDVGEAAADKLGRDQIHAWASASGVAVVDPASGSNSTARWAALQHERLAVELLASTSWAAL